MEIRRQVVFHDLIKTGVNFIYDIHRIRTGLFADRHHDGRDAVGAGKGFFFFPGVFHRSYVGEKNRAALVAGNDDVFEVVDAVEFPHGAHGDGRAVIADFPARCIDICIVYFFKDCLERNTVLRQLFRVRVDFDGPIAGTEKADIGDAFNHLQVIDNDIIQDTPYFSGAPFIGGESYIHDSLRGDIETLYDRLSDAVGEMTADTCHFFADFRCHLPGICPYLKFQHGLGKAFADIGGDGFYSRYLADAVLNRLGDEGFHLFRCRAFISDGDGNHGMFHIGIEIYAQVGVGPEAEYHQHENKHGGEDGPLDKCLDHNCPLYVWEWIYSLSLTCPPSRTLFWPPTMMVSLSVIPPKISTVSLPI